MFNKNIIYKGLLMATNKKITSGIFTLLIIPLLLLIINMRTSPSVSQTMPGASVDSDSSHKQYEVTTGDSLWSIANEAGITVERLKSANDIENDNIKPGQLLNIPGEGSVQLAQEDGEYEEDYIEQDGEFEEEQYSDQPDEEVQDYQDLDTFQDNEGMEYTEEESDIPAVEPEQFEEEEEYTGEDTTDEQIEDDPVEDVTSEEPAEEPSPVRAQPRENTGPQEDIVNLQSEMGLKDLIKTMSEITSEAFVLDDAVRDQKVTIVAPQGGFKKQNALRIFESILDLNGFTIVRKDGINKIVKKVDVKSESIPTEFGSTKTFGTGGFITQIVTLENIRADEVAEAIQGLVTREGDVVVYPSSNKLIIIDNIDNINRILEIISSLDVEKKIEFIKIEHALASEVAEKLLEIFSDEGSSVTSRSQQSRRTTRRTSRARRTANQEQQQDAVSGESDILGFKVITNERTNSLIVIANPQDMTKIKRIIDILDVETDQAESGIYVIPINSADAERIVSVLAGLIGGSGVSTQGVGISGRRGVTGSDSGINRGTSGLSGSGLSGRNRSGLSGRSSFGNTTGTLGSGGLSSGSSFGGLGGGSFVDDITSSGGGLSAVVAETEGLRITADPATNSIIIVGSRRDYEIIKDVIEKLDVRRKQVFVEAAILEVSLEDLQSFGTNFSFGFTVNDDTLGFGGQQLPGVPSLLGVAADSEASLNVVNSLSGLFLGVVGEEVDPDGSGPIPPIPSFTAIFQALTSVTDVNVLSTPSIMTTDNEQAEIVVADVIPFPTGSTVGQAGVTVQTIERLPVGIRLTIVPQIGEGDYLSLNLLTEVSSTRDAPQGLNTAQFGIATTTRSADSSVVVKNGQTIVIGGLVQDRESVLENKTPLLGDIPFVGNLFRFRQKQTQKLNLIILLTPRIVKNEFDMQQILEEQQKRKMLLKEKGFDTLEN